MVYVSRWAARRPPRRRSPHASARVHRHQPASGEGVGCAGGGAWMGAPAANGSPTTPHRVLNGVAPRCVGAVDVQRRLGGNHLGNNAHTREPSLRQRFALSTDLAMLLLCGAAGCVCGCGGYRAHFDLRFRHPRKKLSHRPLPVTPPQPPRHSGRRQQPTAPPLFRGMPFCALSSPAPDVPGSSTPRSDSRSTLQTP